MKKKTIQFKPDNNIIYSCAWDYHTYKNIPDGIIFEIEKDDGLNYVLSGDGFGSKKRYGAGLLYVQKKNIKPKHILKMERVK